MRSTFLLFVLFLTTSIVVFAQTNVIKITLSIKPNNPIKATIWGDKLAFDNPQLITKSSIGNLIKIERSKDKIDFFKITLDENNDGNFSNDESFGIGIDTTTIIKLPIKTKNKQTIFHEYEFIVERDEDRKVDVFRIRPNYSMKGFFSKNNCKIPLLIIDKNADGVFTHKENGTNLIIDRNNDGKISNRDESAITDEIIELCGKNYLISNLAKDGSSLTLNQTKLQNVKLFQKSPKFDFTLVNNKSFSSDEFNGKPFLLDFWASWCGPCIAKIPEVKQIEGKLPVIYFNTDTIKQKQQALNLINKLNIFDNSVLRVSPKADNFYKSYQRLYWGLPYYALIDSEGRIRYAGNGGEDLKELKGELKKLGID